MRSAARVLRFQRRPISNRVLLAINVMLAAVFGALVFTHSPLSFDASTPDVPIVGRALIIDGDTIDIGGQRVRLHGVDAPESRQTCRDVQGVTYSCGRDAAGMLAGRIGFNTVTCESRSIDRYGRSVAVCRSNGEELNTWLVRNGWAVAYLSYGGWEYAFAEVEARIGRRGIWAGEFTRPDKWRHSN